MEVGEDFFLGYPPERVDPGNTKHARLLVDTRNAFKGIPRPDIYRL